MSDAPFKVSDGALRVIVDAGEGSINAHVAADLLLARQENERLRADLAEALALLSNVPMIYNERPMWGVRLDALLSKPEEGT